jgi:hypothetical protein
MEMTMFECFFRTSRYNLENKIPEWEYKIEVCSPQQVAIKYILFYQKYHIMTMISVNSKFFKTRLFIRV